MQRVVSPEDLSGAQRCGINHNLLLIPTREIGQYVLGVNASSIDRWGPSICHRASAGKPTSARFVECPSHSREPFAARGAAVDREFPSEALPGVTREARLPEPNQKTP